MVNWSWSTVQRRMVDGQWLMVNGQWGRLSMVDGQWSMAHELANVHHQFLAHLHPICAREGLNGQWSMVNGQWLMNSRMSTTSFLRTCTQYVPRRGSLFNGQWSTVNGQ